MDEELTSQHSIEPPNPTEDEVVKALTEIDQASNRLAVAASSAPDATDPDPSWTSSPATIGIFSVAMFAAIGMLAWGIQRAVRGVFSFAAQSGEKSRGAELSPASDKKPGCSFAAWRNWFDAQP